MKVSHRILPRCHTTFFPIHVIPHDFHISPHSLPNERVRERDREEYSETGGSYTDFFTRGGYTEWLGATEGFSDGVSSESFDESSEETGEDDDEWGLEEWAGVQPSLDPPPRAPRLPPRPRLTEPTERRPWQGPPRLSPQLLGASPRRLNEASLTPICTMGSHIACFQFITRHVFPDFDEQASTWKEWLRQRRAISAAGGSGASSRVDSRVNSKVESRAKSRSESRAESRTESRSESAEPSPRAAPSDTLSEALPDSTRVLDKGEATRDSRLASK